MAPSLQSKLKVDRQIPLDKMEFILYSPIYIVWRRKGRGREGREGKEGKEGNENERKKETKKRREDGIVRWRALQLEQLDVGMAEYVEKRDKERRR